MPLRRQTMVTTVLAMALVASPVMSVAAPDDPSGRAQLPPAAYNAEVPRVASDRGRSPVGTSSPESTTIPRRQPPRALAALGASNYVDECEGNTGRAYDVRRLGFAMHNDANTVQLTMRPCDPDTLTDFDGHTLTWTTVATEPETTNTDPQARTIEVTGIAPDALDVTIWRLEKNEQTGKREKAEKLPGGTAWLGETPSGVSILVVDFPSDHLGLSGSCSPNSGVACLQFRFESVAPGGASAGSDTLPNPGIRPPLWPSRCGGDVDPASVGHVRLTTSSSTAARDVAGALHRAGYHADAYPDAPYVEVPVGASPAVVEVLEGWDDVVDITPVTTRRMTAVTPDDPEYGKQWYLPAIGAPSAWESTTGSDAVGIAIVDNGVAADRPDLMGRVKGGWDAMAGTALGRNVHSDLGGHGTAVAGLAAGTGDNGTGITGVDWKANVHPVRVFDHEGCFVSEPNYLAALDWIAREAGANRIHVANFSLGGGVIPGEAERIEKIVDHGATVVAAMGNEGDVTGSLTSYPAALPEVIAVGATGPDDRLASYSNRGRHLDVVAPGGDQGDSPRVAMWTMADPTVVGEANPYTAQAGTSFSSPLVAGLAALYRAEYPDSTPADAARALLTTARDLGEDLAGFDISYGFGMVDATQVFDHTPGQTLVRLAGGDRYETAARISQRAFRDPDLVDVVLLATGQDYPDALAGGPLAAREHAPLLLTPRDVLHDATRDEILRLGPQRVLLLGGTAALSAGVQAELEGMGVMVDRAAGGDRYETARAIALGSATSSWRTWKSSDVVFLATGQNFPDALPGGAAAAAADAPLLLTSRTRLPDATREALEQLRPSIVVVLGGPAAITDDVVIELNRLGMRAPRAQGGDRYATASVAAQCPFSPCQAGARYVVVATGEGFADALGGSAAAAALRAPLLLVPRSGDVPDAVAGAMASLAPEQALVLGGTVPISAQMADDVSRLVVR